MIPFEEVIHKKLANVIIRSLGGYSGECIEFQVRSQAMDTLSFFIEPGRKLVSEVEGYQGIFVVGKKEITLPPGRFQRFTMQGYCGNASKKSPAFNLCYLPGEKPDSASQVLSLFLEKNKVPNGQSAVWALTDGHPVASIVLNGTPEMLALRTLVATLTHQKIPNYNLHYDPSDSLVFSGKPKLISGKLEYLLKHQTEVTIYVKNQTGQVVHKIATHLPQKQGKQRYDLNLDVLGWLPGKYKVEIQGEAAMVMAQLDFEL